MSHYIYKNCKNLAGCLRYNNILFFIFWMGSFCRLFGLTKKTKQLFVTVVSKKFIKKISINLRWIIFLIQKPCNCTVPGEKRSKVQLVLKTTRTSDSYPDPTIHNGTTEFIGTNNLYKKRGWILDRGWVTEIATRHIRFCLCLVFVIQYMMSLHMTNAYMTRLNLQIYANLSAESLDLANNNFVNSPRFAKSSFCFWIRWPVGI